MRKNRYPKLAGVNNHYKKRAILTALLLSALFCWENEISATTYENDKIMINGALYQKTTGYEDTLVEDSNDLILKGQTVTVKNNIAP